MEGVLHARRTDPRLADWLEAVCSRRCGGGGAGGAHPPGGGRARKVPADLAQEIARVTSVAQGIWAEARAADDVAPSCPRWRRWWR